jgi:hypothetical protein
MIDSQMAEIEAIPKEVAPFAAMMKVFVWQYWQMGKEGEDGRRVRMDGQRLLPLTMGPKEKG